MKYGDKEFFMVAGGGAGKSRTAFWEELNILYKKLGDKDRYVGIHDQAQEWYTALDQPQKRLEYRRFWTIDQVQKAWLDLSLMPQPDPSAQRIQYIRVRSRSGSADDNEVEVMSGTACEVKWSSGSRSTESLLAQKLAEATGTTPTALYQNISKDYLKRESLLEGSQPVGASGQGRLSQGGEGGEGIGGSPPGNPSNRSNPGNPGSTANDEYWLGTIDIPGDPQVKRIPNDTLRTFVGGFRSMKFGLVSEPKSNTKVKFLEKDQWNCLFGDVLATNSPMQMVVDDKAQPSGFLFAMTPPDLGFSLDFSTEAVYKAFDMVKETAPKIGLSTQSTMIFGLEPGDGDKPIKSTLLQMMKYIKLEHMIENPLVQLLTPELELTLSVKNGSRNAVWFQPAYGNQITQRLQWSFNATPLNDALEKAGVKIKLQDAFVVTTRTAVLRPGPRVLLSGELRLHTTVDSEGKDLDLMCSIRLRKDGFSMTINASKSTRDAFVTWLKKVLGEELSLTLDGIEYISKIITPRRLSLNIQTNGGKISMRDWSVYLEATINSVPVFLFYDNSNKLLQGQVWVVSNKTTEKLLPSWEQSDELLPSDWDPTKRLKLSDLLHLQEDTIPTVIPNTIETAEIRIDLSTKTIGFTTTLAREPAESEPGDLPFSIDTLDMRVSYSPKAGLKASFFFTASLHMSDPDEEDEGGPAEIRGAIEYDAHDKSWKLSASIDVLNFKSLYNFLDPNAQEDVAAILGHFELGGLKLEYEYGKGRGGNFTLSGGLYIGPVRLFMKYTYNDQWWSLEANLSAANAEDGLTLGDIVDDLTDNYGDDAEDLPDFIRRLSITGSDGDLIRIRCAKVSSTTGQVATATDNPKEAYLLFQATISLGTIEISFFHYRDLLIGKKGDAPKRVFKISMSPLPAINMKDTLGTLGSMPQPFDEIAYVWVQDKQNQRDNPNQAGLTQQDVDRINRGLPKVPGSDQSDPGESNRPNEVFILYRDTRKPGKDKKPTDMVVPTGSHFMVIATSANTQRAIIDYTLGRKKKKGQETIGVLATKKQGQDGKSTKAELKKIAGK